MSIETSHTARGLDTRVEIDARTPVGLGVDAVAFSGGAQADLFAHTRVGAAPHDLAVAQPADSLASSSHDAVASVGGPATNALVSISTGQLWFGVIGGGGELGVGNFNNAGSGFTEYASSTQPNGSAAITIGLDTAAGLYFTANGDHLTISSHLISTGAVVQTLQVADGFGTPSGLDDELIQGLTVDPVSHVIYVSRFGSTTGPSGNTGILKIDYVASGASLGQMDTPDGAYNNTAANQYLVHGSASGAQSPTFARYMDLDTANHKLYYVDNSGNYVGAPFNTPTNGVFVVDTSNPGAGVTQLTLDSQFAANTGNDPGESSPRIGAVAVNSAQGLVYFTTYQTHADGSHNSFDGLWVMSTAGGTATKILGTSAELHYAEPNGGLVYDAQNQQLYITDGQVTAAANDRHIVLLQMSANGQTVASTLGTYGIDQLVGHTADPNAYTSGLEFNALPIFGLGATTTHAGEQGGGIDLSTTLSATDADGGYLKGATVKITNGTFSANETSSSDDHLGYGAGVQTSGMVAGTAITLSYDASTETLTLSGYDTLANYQAVLDGLRFSSTGDNPTNYGSNTTRTVAWSIDDGTVGGPTNGQNTGTSTVTIDAVNDAATITATSAGSDAKAVTETNAGLSASGSLTITDADTLTNTMSVVSVTESGATSGISNATLLSYLTLGSGSATHAANVSSTTDTFAFNSGSEAFNYLAPGQSLVLTYVVRANDGTTNVDHNVTITINGTNDAPAGTDNTVTLLEDATRTFSASDFGFTDVDGGALQGVKFTTVPGAGALLLNGVPVSAGQTVAAAEIDAGHLTFAPAANASGAGYASLTFQVQDNQGVVSGGVDLDQSPNTLTFNVTAVNDAPAGTDKIVSMLEDASYTFVTADFGFTDPNDSPANSLQAVKITTLPANGSLTLNGVAVSLGDLVSATDISAGHLVFAPAANANGAGYGNFTFQVQDNGGVANGGVDLDQSPNSFTINVGAVNDAPSGADNTITTLEDTAHVFTVADFGFSDATDGNSLQAVKITTIPGAGSLTLNGVVVTAGQSITVANITAGNLQFTPAANAHGGGYADFTFQVQDNGGVANGGVDTDQSPNTITLNVTSVNDAPSGADATVTTLEDTAYTFGASDFGFSDVDGNSLMAVKITTLPASGTLSDNGVAVNAGDYVSKADILGGKLVFTPAADAHGAAQASFTFQVQDDGGVTNGGVDLDQSANTITVNVTAVNDAPSAADKTITTLEDTAYTFQQSDFGFSDIDGDNLQAVKIGTITGGSLTLNGGAVNAGDSVNAVDLANLVFTPAANVHGTGAAGFSFQVQDDGGVANGGDDLSSAKSITFDVTSVNDAPSGADKTVTTAEDAAYTFQASDFGFSDVIDGDSLLAVKITTLPASGTLSDNGLLVNAGDYVSKADIDAGKLVFTPVTNAHGAAQASFTFQVQDDGGTTNGGVDLDQIANTITVNVTSVNDAPSAADKTITTLEDTAYTFQQSDFGFSDTDGDNLQAVKIGTITGGSLTLNGGAVNAGDSVNAVDLANLVFTPAANVHGTGVAGFSFQVQDDGGVANGGDDLSSAKSITFDVTSVNDAPSAVNHTVTTLEDTDYVFQASDFGFSDPIDGDSLMAVKITTLPGAGILTLNGSVVSAGDFVQANDIGNLVWHPPGDGNGASLASFTFQVQDDGGTANGGADLSTAQTLTFDVTAQNDAPVVNNGIPDHDVYFDDSFIFSMPSDAFADVEGDSLTYTAVIDDGGGVTHALPSWLTFNAATGKFSGTPPKSDIGALQVQVTASDSHGGSVSTDFTLTIVGNMTINGNASDETLRGHNGDDVITGNGGHDTLIGSAGADTLSGGLGADKLSGGTGDDVMRGGGGGDSLDGGSGRDVVLYYDSATGVHVDLADQSLNSGGALGDTLVNVERVAGSSHDDSLMGGSGHNWLKGAAGNDYIYGKGSSDTLRGGDGADTLHGGGGHDLLIGGAGADVFDFSSVTDSGRSNSDLIQDFHTAEGDRLDISLLDGDAATPMDFLGAAHFTGAGDEVRYVVRGGDAYVMVDLDGDKNADFQVRLLNVATLHAGDFVL